METSDPRNFDNKYWESKMKEYGIIIAHPGYDEDEEYILRYKSAKELRFAEPDLKNTAPPHLIQREAVRRHVLNKTTNRNNYAKLAVRAYQRNENRIIQNVFNGLTEDFIEKPGAGGNTGDVYRKFGELDGKGNAWSPIFSAWIPLEEFAVKGKIDRLQNAWWGRSYRYGKKNNKSIADTRKKWKADGTAMKMIIEFGLAPDKYLSKLSSEYTGDFKHKPNMFNRIANFIKSIFN